MMTFTKTMCVVHRACPTLRMKIEAYQLSNDDVEREILRVAMLTDVYLHLGGHERLFTAIRTKWLQLCQAADDAEPETTTTRSCASADPNS